MIELTERFSIYSSPESLLESDHGIGLLFVPEPSPDSFLPRRSEKIILKAIECLEEFQPTFHLLEERNEETRFIVNRWFPESYRPHEVTGNGSIVWISEGEPKAYLEGGPYLALLDVIRSSREAWGQA